MKNLFEVMKRLWAKRQVKVALVLLILAALLAANAGGAISSITDVSRLYAGEDSDEDPSGSEDGEKDDEKSDDDDHDDGSGSSDDGSGSGDQDGAVDPAADPAVDPAADPAADPAVDPAADPAADPAVDPAADPAADPAVDPAADPAADPAVDPAVDPAADPAVIPAPADVDVPETSDDSDDDDLTLAAGEAAATAEGKGDDTSAMEAMDAADAEHAEVSGIEEQVEEEAGEPLVENEEQLEEEVEEIIPFDYEEEVLKAAEDDANKNPISFSEIKSAMSTVGKFSYFTESINLNGHTEGTIAANDVFLGNLCGLFMDRSGGYSASVDENGNFSRRNRLMGNTIFVKETIYDENHNPVEGRQVYLGVRSEDGKVDFVSDARTTDSNGVAYAGFYVPAGTYRSYVKYSGEEYEKDGIDADGLNIKFSDPITVTNPYGDNVSYFQDSFEYNSSGGLNNPGFIVAGSENVYKVLEPWSKLNQSNNDRKVRVIKAYGADASYSPINIKNELNSLADFSVKLANSKTSDDVVVYNFDYNSLPGNPGIVMGDHEFAVINLVVPENATSIGLFSLVNDKCGDFNPAYQPEQTEESAKKAYWGARQLINLIVKKDDGTYAPFAGTASVSSGVGIIFAPDANINQGAIAGSLIARNIPKAGGEELHALSFMSDVTSASGVLNIVVGGEPENEDKVTKVIIEKVDDEKNPLDGAEFEVYSDQALKTKLSFNTNGTTFEYAADGVVSTLTTYNGSITITGLPAGKTYYIKETKLPEGVEDEYRYDYSDKAPDGVTSFTLAEAEDAETSVTIENTKVIIEKPKGSLEVSKVVYDGETVVNGGTYYFVIRNATTKELVVNPATNGTVFSITGGNTIIVSDLPDDVYTVEEVEDETGKALSDNFGYAVSYSSPKVYIKGEYMDASFTITNRVVRGDITLVKKADDNTPVEGAQFKLYNGSKPYSDKVYTTDTEGKIFVNSLPFGTYHFVEIKQAPGFVAPTADSAVSASVTISNKKLSGVIEMTNTKLRGSVSIQKTDEKGKDLPGALFVLKKADESPVGVSGADGVYKYDASVKTAVKMACDTNGALKISALPLGTYILEETDTPKGYTGAVVKRFELTEDEINSSFTIENTKYYASIQFTKLDGEDKKSPVSGAEFVVWDIDEDKEFTRLTSGEDGVVKCDFVPEGHYYVKEVKAPDGYDLNGNTYQFVVDSTKDNGTLIVLKGDDGKGNIYDQRLKGSLSLEKLDCTTSDYTSMEGVKFTIRREKSFFKFIKTKEDVATLVTDKDGKASYTGLDWGEYQLIETAPEGYDAVTKTFEIGANSSHVEFTTDSKNGPIKDYKLTTTIKVKKLDSESKGKLELSGAEFYVYRMLGSVPDPSKDERVGQVKTDAFGEAEFIAEYGNYYFVEYKAPFGYELDDTTAYQVVADGTGKNSEVTVYNKKKLGKVVVKKVDDDGKALAGAVFTLYSYDKPEDATILQQIADFVFKDGSVMYEWRHATADSNGIAEFTDIPYGKYYLKETGVPVGYTITNSSTREITVVAADDTTQEFEVVNKKSSSSSSEKKSSSSSSEKKTSSSSVKKSSSSSSEKEKPVTSSSSEKKTSSSSSEKKTSSSSSVKTSSSSSEKKTSSSSSEKEKPVTSSSSEKKTSSSSSEKKSSSSSSEAEKPASSSSSEKEISSSSEKKSSSSSSEAEKPASSSSSEKESSSSSEKKSSSSSSEAEKPASSSSSEKESSSSSEKKSSSSSSEAEKPASSSSSEKESSSSSEKKSSSSSSEAEKPTSSSSSEKESSSSSSEKESSSSSSVKDSSSSSEKKSSSSSSEKKSSSSSSVKDEQVIPKDSSSSSSKKHHKTSSSKKTRDADSARGGEYKPVPMPEDIPATVETYSPDDEGVVETFTDGFGKVLGVTAPPEVISDVLGDIAAPLTGDDLSPAFYLFLAGLALVILITLIVVTRRRRY